MADTKLKINIGGNQFVVNCADYTCGRKDELTEKMLEIIRTNSIFTKYPMEEEESREKWQERVQKDMDKDKERKEGESVEEHLKRVLSPKNDAQEMALATLNAIAETFGLRQVTPEDLKNTNWLAVKRFLFDVLSMGDVPGADVFWVKDA